MIFPRELTVFHLTVLLLAHLPDIVFKADAFGITSTARLSSIATVPPRKLCPVFQSQRNVAGEATTYSVEAQLLDRLEKGDESEFIVEGYVVSKRSLGKQLLFVDFVTSEGDLCQAMIRQEYYTGRSYTGYRKTLLKGARFQIKGIAAPTRNPGNVVLLVHELVLLGFPRQIQHIQIILEQANQAELSMEEVCRAAPPPFQRVEDLQLPTDIDSSSSKQSTKAWFKETARSIYQSLPDDPNYPDSADQKKLSRQGNFAVQDAPPEWKLVPHPLKEKMDDDWDAHPFATIVEMLESRGESIETPDPIRVSGWVQNRRRFDQNVTMLSLVDDLSLLSEDTSEVKKVDRTRLRCILHPDFVLPAKLAGTYRNLVTVGAKLEVTGHLEHSASTAEVTLWINSIQLVRSSSSSTTIRTLLDLVQKQEIALPEAETALLYSEELDGSFFDLDATQLQWKANELALRLQTDKTTKTTGSILDPRLLGTIQKYKNATQGVEIIATSLGDMEGFGLSSSGTTKSKEGSRLPMGMPGSKWQSKKRPQLAWMRERIQKVLQSHPEYGKRKLKILDIGGGKGSLAHYLGNSIENVQIHVVDICEGAVANGKAKSDRLRLPVDFSLADASQKLEVSADVVVALHACGHLSDVALAHAIYRNAGFVIVPCCFNSNPRLTLPLEEQESTKVSDWLEIPEADWTDLKLLAEVQGDIPLASEAIVTICALRARAAMQQRQRNQKVLRDQQVSIQTFPIEFSTRNTVLVGKCG